MRVLKSLYFCLLAICVSWALIVAGLAYATSGDFTFRGSSSTMPEAGHLYSGQKYISAQGTVDLNSGGQGVRVKLDAAGITWTGLNLNGVSLTTEALVVSNAGIYFVGWSTAIDGTQGKEYLFEIVTDTNNDPSDGSPVAHASCELDFTVQANTHGPVSSMCLVVIAAGEFIYLAVQEPGGGAATNFDADHGSLVLFQL